MKRIYSILTILMCFVSSIFAEEYVNNDTIHSLEEVSVVSVYRNRINVGSLISNTELQKVKHKGLYIHFCIGEQKKPTGANVS